MNEPLVWRVRESLAFTRLVCQIPEKGRNHSIPQLPSLVVDAVHH